MFAVIPAFDVFSLSSYSETFPMSVLEAMACGVPVVATKVGGLPEMVTDGREGLLVPPRDPEALADAWFRVASDPAARGEMGRAALEKVARDFTAERMVREYAELFDRLMLELG